MFCSRAISQTFKVPWTFTSNVACGFLIERGTEPLAAKWTMESTLLAASLNIFLLATDPSNTSTSRPEIFDFSPVEKSSKTFTSWFWLKRDLTRLEPIKPAPPVTKTRSDFST